MARLGEMTESDNDGPVPDGTEQALDKSHVGSFGRWMCLLTALAGARPHRLRIEAMAAALVGIIGALAYGQTALNAWNGSFYDTIGRRDFSALWASIGMFLAIAGTLLLL